MKNWKTIEYRGRNFTVSDHGDVKCSNGKDKCYSLHKNSSGYLCITMDKVYLAHRMTAIAFIPNPDNKPFVNHKDGNKSNNHVSNLEWVTKQENELHSVRVLGNKRNTSGLKANWENPIQCRRCVLIEGDLRKEFKSIKDCAVYKGVGSTAIWNKINSKYKSYKGYTVSYLE